VAVRFGKRPVLGLWLTAMTLLVGMVTFAAPAQAVAAPTGLSPTGPVSSSTPTLSWTKAAGAVSYEVQVDDSTSFDTPSFAVTTTNNRAVPTTHLPNGDLFWRVRSVASGGGKSGWATEQISIDPTAPPSPLSPVDGTSLAQPDEPPLLTWTPVSGATSYEIEVDVDGDWVSPSTYTAPGTSFLIPNPQAATTWYWRVRAVRGNGLVTLWSDPADYQVQSLADVEIDPDMAAETTSPIQDVALDWLPVAGAKQYEVQVGLDQDFTIPVETRVVYSTRYSPTTTYDNDQFFWRVRAIDAAGTKMAWPSVPFEFQRNWPQRPSLLHPADQLAPTTSDDFYYQWTPVPHATRYELQVGSDPNFSPNTYDVCDTASTTYTAGYAGTSGASNDLCMPSQGNVTYWRVRAIDAPLDVEGIYSETHRFVYDSGEVVQTSPASGASVGVPTLKWQASRDAEKYVVEVRDSTDALKASTTTYALSWTPEGASQLDPADGPFTWTVQAVDSNGAKSPKYPGNTFSLTGVMPTTGAPALTPLTGVDNTSTIRSPALSWEPHPDAAYYKIQIGVAGSGFWLNTSVAHILTAKYPYPAATDIDKYFMTPGSYDWRVQAFGSDNASLGYGPVDTFRISDLASVSGQQIALDGLALDAGTTCDAVLGQVVTEEDICTEVPATPVLDWSPIPGAAFYMVYVANDREMTNRIFTGAAITNTRWTPTTNMVKEALADNQAGQSYYWYIRPCKGVSVCGPDPISTNAAATNAFRKISPKVVLQSPADGSVKSDDITFDWADYYDTNQARTYQGGAEPSPQTAYRYRIEISQSSTFSTTVDVREVDQSTYTPFDGTLPEGILHWRVQAIDAENNHLNWSVARQVTKQSGTVTLTSPVGGAGVGGATPFEWQAKDFAGLYSIEVYKNDDATFSSSNRVLSSTSKQTAFVWNKYLPAASSAYLWRVRWTDGDGHIGPWSSAGRFFVHPGVVTQSSPGNGAYQPAAGPYFTWQPVSSASKYYVEARRVGSTSSSIRITTVAQAAAATGTLADGTYEWRVTAYDPSGGVLGQSVWRRFKVDTTAPVVVSKAPLTTATRTANFVAKFNEKVTGVTASTMKLYVAGRTTKLAATVTLSSDGRTATLNPSANLVVGKYYTVKLTSDIKDLAGNRLVATSWKVKAT